MFTEHGGFHVELCGNILLLDIKGAWNIETSLAYQIAISEAIKPIIGQRWAVLTLMDEWELCTPDSELLIIEIVENAIDAGLVREAVVNKKGAIKLELFEKHRKKAISIGIESPFKRRIYEDKQSALKWLASEGFTQSENI